MARDLDLENLSAEDKQYIVDRPWLMEEITLQGGDLAELGIVDDAPADPRNIVRSPSVDSGSLVGDSARREEEEAAQTTPDDEYVSMKKDELVAELEARDLPTSGTKSDLQQRLRDDDAEPDDEDDEEQ